eukprot:gnl/MRDRNA2_/MRDRNA2_73222_c0_seq1.p1 gnl/MRDRNA2_/MRDRNA2_73222_c0~~gnl/MRDRNA2_/MRDRNA2_73222_c0_seq1.p1  ORF type:complete len:135 (-),score=13.72 gnl/MRDRNA2_/MRDRNA2_73222_c0_seq1:499-852(-)
MATSIPHDSEAGQSFQQVMVHDSEMRPPDVNMPLEGQMRNLGPDMSGSDVSSMEEGIRVSTKSPRLSVYNTEYGDEDMLWICAKLFLFCCLFFCGKYGAVFVLFVVTLIWAYKYLLV